MSKISLKEVLELCETGRISVGKAAQILGQSIYDIHRIAKAKGLKLTANEEQLEKSRKLRERGWLQKQVNPFILIFSDNRK